MYSNYLQFSLEEIKKMKYLIKTGNIKWSSDIETYFKFSNSLPITSSVGSIQAYNKNKEEYYIRLRFLCNVLIS